MAALQKHIRGKKLSDLQASINKLQAKTGINTLTSLLEQSEMSPDSERGSDYIIQSPPTIEEFLNQNKNRQQLDVAGASDVAMAEKKRQQWQTSKRPYGAMTKSLKAPRDFLRNAGLRKD